MLGTDVLAWLALFVGVVALLLAAYTMRRHGAQLDQLRNELQAGLGRIASNQEEPARRATAEFDAIQHKRQEARDRQR